MRTFEDMLSDQLKDEEFRKEYETIQPEMDAVRAIVDAGTSQHLTQKETEKHICHKTGGTRVKIGKSVT